MKDKTSKTVLIGFLWIVNESKCKSNKLWVDQGWTFYKNLMQNWLGDIEILMYLTHNEGKPVVAERLIRTLRVKSIKR